MSEQEGMNVQLNSKPSLHFNDINNKLLSQDVTLILANHERGHHLHLRTNNNVRIELFHINNIIYGIKC